MTLRENVDLPCNLAGLSTKELVRTLASGMPEDEPGDWNKPFAIS